MNTLRLRIMLACMATVSIGLGLVIQGCGAPDIGSHDCNPDPLLPSPRCPGDAGSDAATDDDVGDAGPDATAAAACSGICAPWPHDTDGALWAFPPVVFWHGPTWKMENGNYDVPACPGGEEYLQWLRFDGLEAPPASCEPCECEAPKGECAGLPAEIEIRAGLSCDPNAPTLPFDGPAGWDGSCTNANALPAGAKCPAGSSNLCAQSVWASALPGPTEGPCAPKKQAPAFTTETKWTTAGIACIASSDPCACDDEGDWRVADLPVGFEVCTWREGLHECPEQDYTWGPYWMYGEDPEEHRGCEECNCGSPEGGGCVSSLSLYDDAACGAEFGKLPLSSVKPGCVDVSLPGRALGSKSIPPPVYVPGTCGPGGGVPIGEAKANPTTAVTFCCLGPFWEIR
jgi:hypothetical protein